MGFELALVLFQFYGLSYNSWFGAGWYLGVIGFDLLNNEFFEVFTLVNGIIGLLIVFEVIEYLEAIIYCVILWIDLDFFVFMLKYESLQLKIRMRKFCKEKFVYYHISGTRCQEYGFPKKDLA